MQKKILIIVGIIVILLLISVWVYLLVFGTPKNLNEVFTDFGTTAGEVQNTTNTQEPATEQPVVDVTQSKLRQLTTKPVAGFTELTSTTTNTKVVYYAEMGTGHINSIDLKTGEDKRVSGTTVAGVNSAIISAKGDYVVFGNRSNDKNNTITIGKISTSTNEIITKDFTKMVTDFTITDDGNDFLYTTKDQNGLFGYVYNLKSGTEKALFTVPFHEAIIQWGNSANSTHYLYPKPTYLLEGYLYQIKAGKISRLPVSGYGLSALANDDIIAYSRSENGQTNNYLFDRKTKTTQPLTTTILPEKCLIAVSGYKLICAWQSGSEKPLEFPDKWYQGVIQFKDSIWNIYGEDAAIKLISDVSKESGREIDITNLTIGADDRIIYFINKNDNTLWMYEI